MPIQFVFWIVAALFASGVTLLSWNRINAIWAKKNIAIIGARGVGKTHLCKFLAEGEIPEEYEQTTEPKKFSGNTLKMKDLKLKINDIIDVPGSKDYYRIWEENCNKADIILYLIKSVDIFAEDKSVEKRVEEDLKRINNWLENKKQKPFFMIIGTFFDKYPEYEKITPSNFGYYKDKFEQTEIIKRFKVHSASNGSSSAVILGSMKSKDDTQKLVVKILEQYSIYYNIQ